MFVQITATLMGFAFITPVLEAMSSGLFKRSTNFIEAKILYKKVLGMISLPIFLFFWPFLISILLITNGDINNDKIQTAIIIGNIAFGVFCLILFIWIKNYSGFEAGFLINVLQHHMPWVILLGYIFGVSIYVFYMPTILYLNFANFIYLTNLLFISLGISLIFRNFMTPFDSGLWFEFSEIYSIVYCDIKKEFKSIEQALNSREELVNKCESAGLKERYAKGSSEITFLCEQFKGREGIFEGLYDKWEKITKKRSKLSLNDVFEFDDSRKRIVEDYLPEFERATNEINMLLESKHVEHPITETFPLFSVVIPTQGRCNLVEKLLISLQKAIENSKVPVEVIIVDDSPQPEQDKIDAFCWQYGAQYLSGSHSVSEKRNFGIEKSRGQYILFTDSDCEVSPNIFDEHLKVYAEADTTGVLGITKFTGKENITWKIVSRTMFLDSFSFAETLSKYSDSAPWGPCTNLSFRKEVLEKVGKFDTTLPFGLAAGGEDTELGVRINEAGYKIKMNPNAIVFHTRETWSRLGALFKKAFRWGRADFHILKKHPQLGQVAFPSFFTVLLLIALVCLAYILVGYSDIALKIIVVWMLSMLLLEAIIKADKKPYLKLPCFIFLDGMATLLNLAFDAGTAFESLRRGSLSMLYKRIIYTPALLSLEWKSEAVRSWSITIGLLLTLIVMWALKGV